LRGRRKMHRDAQAARETRDSMLWRGFQKPKRLAVDAETLSDTFGKFSAQPFERGFGTTIGNALRRTLLSSIEGAAVTAIRIEGVLHEFQSITGVVEDATDIILNLKQVPFKLAGEGTKALYLRADQLGVVTSGMIEADGDVEILDKNKAASWIWRCASSVGAAISRPIKTSTPTWGWGSFPWIRSTRRCGA